MRIQEQRVRQVVGALGLGTVAFGVAPLVAPGRFARLFGLAAPDAATESVLRSTGLRDAVMGLGLWSAATHGGAYAPWLLARLLTDGGDTLAVGLAVAKGARSPRFLALGALALGAALGDASLYWAARASRRGSDDASWQRRED